MRYAVVSDIHSNLDALEAVLAFLKGKNTEATLFCGDLVGYGAEPDACLERLAALPGLSAVTGNHDLAVLGKMDLDWFNSHARDAVIWTRKNLGARSRSFLESLSDRVETADFTVVHGSPRSPADEYLLSTEQFLANLEHFKVSPCFIGHSHLPVSFCRLPSDRVQGGPVRPGQTLDLAAAGPWIINPGSVGQPRDGDKRASCGVYDSAARTFELFRVEYPVAAAQAKIRKAGLPEMLASRLSYGE